MNEGRWHRMYLHTMYMPRNTCSVQQTCVCLHACVCVRVCMRACMHACVCVVIHKSIWCLLYLFLQILCPILLYLRWWANSAMGHCLLSGWTFQTTSGGVRPFMAWQTHQVSPSKERYGGQAATFCGVSCAQHCQD